MKSYNILSLLIMGSLMTACGGRESTSIQSRGTDDDSNTSTTTNYRICTMPLSGATSSSLSGFFGVTITGIEDVPTWCGTLTGTGSYVRGDIRVEVEYSKGIRYFDSSVHDADVYYGKLSSDQLNLEVIWVDAYGFIRLKASRSNTSQNFSGTIRYAEFPTYQEALDEAMAKAAEACKNGTKTVAQCLGYNFPPTYWWNQVGSTSSTSTAVTNAQALIDSKGTNLGSVNFALSDVF